MTTALQRLSDRQQAFYQLAADIRCRHRSLLHELRIEPVEDGVVLYGRAYNFYGKQIALHEVRERCAATVRGNRITVA